jgi:hypothetical protein
MYLSANILIASTLFLSSCGLLPNSYVYVIEDKAGSSSEITGKYSISGLSLSTDWEVGLYEVGSDELLASGHVDLEEGVFKISIQDIKIDDSKSYLIKMTNGSEQITRLMTQTTEQDLDASSTLVSYLAEHEDIRTDRKELHVFIKRLQEQMAGESSKVAIYERLSTDSESSARFKILFGRDVAALRDIPPRLIRHNLPRILKEGAEQSVSILASHWHPEYEVAYLIQLADKTIASLANFTIRPGADEQGEKIFKIYLGQKDNLSALDQAKPMIVRTYEVTIEDTIPAKAPSFVIQGTPSYVSTRDITLEITTDAFRKACESFSHFAITENTTHIPPLASFVHTCDSENVQEMSYRLSTALDGQNTLRIYAMDSSGSISPSSTPVSVILDTAAPTGTVNAFTTTQKGGATVSLVYNIQDLGSGLQSLVLERSDDNGSTYSHVTNLDISQTSYNVTHEAADRAAVIYRVIATDVLNQASTITQNLAFAIDATAPLAPSVSRHSAAVTNTALATITAANCDDTAQILVQEVAAAPNGSEAGWQSCSTTAGALTHTVNNTGFGLKTLYVWAKDEAGNVSASSTDLTLTLDITEPVITVSNLNTYYRASQSVDLEWTLTEDLATNTQSFAVELSSNGGTSWSAVTTLAGPDGSVTNGAYTVAVTLPASAGTQYRYRVSLIDAAGNTGSSQTASFTIDTQAPIVTALSINNGASVVGKNTVNVSITASDNHAVSHYRLKERTTNCQSDYADDNWQSYTGTGPYSYSMSNINGEKVLCVWVKDGAGNVSVISTNSGDGTQGVDRYLIVLDVGSPPIFTSVSAVNNNSASAHYQSRTVEAGDQVLISWSITDSGGLAESPISIQMSTNGTSYTTIAENLGDLPEGTTSWSSTYTGYSATGSGFLRFRVIAKDSVENTLAVLTAPLNTGAWSVYAGTNDNGNDGTALSAKFGPMGGSFAWVKQIVAAVSNDDIYVSDASNQIRRIDASTGIISRYLSLGSELNVPGPVADARIPAMSSGGVNMVSDSAHSIYVVGGSRIYRINTQNNTVARYAGGGSSLSDGASGLDASILSNTPLAINPINGDLYYAAKCSGINAIAIYKLTQNSDGSAGTISHFAGSCEIGAIGQNVDAKLAPLVSNSHYWNSVMISYVPSVNALYAWVYSNPSRLIKIIDGKMFNRSSGWGVAMAYSSQHNKLYFNNRSLVPTSSHAVESDQVEIGTSHIIGCNADAIEKLNACAIFHGATLNSNGNLVFSDGIAENQTSSFRVRRLDDDGYIRTVAGVQAFAGIDESSSVTRFGVLRALRYRKGTDANLAMFPRGLYFGDGEATVIGRIDPDTMTTKLVAGNQLSLSIADGDSFGPNLPLGTKYTSTSAGFFDFDPSGMLAFYSSTHRIFRVDVSSVIRNVMAGGSIFITQSSGASALATNVRFYGARNGLVFDNSGRLYGGGRPASSDSSFALGPKLFVVNISTDTFYDVIHGGSNAVSADDPAPGNAVNKSLSCSTGIANCYLQYDRVNDRLLFGEGSRIRVITTPYDDTQSTLGTLMHTDGITPINLGRTVGAFEYIAALNRVYYLSNGHLYCYDLAQSAPAIPTCNNTSLGFPSQLGSLNSTAIAVGESNSEVFVRSTNVIYRYQINE